MELNGQPSRSQPFAAVIFDMDGTLTRPRLDFDAIRAEIGLPTHPRMPILESLEVMDPQARSRAEAILERHEEEAARDCELYADAVHVLEAIRGAGMWLGLLTRNSPRCTEMVLASAALTFDRVHTRVDGPPKPAPDAILKMCGDWQISAARVLVVGDYLFDIQAGRAAGAKTALIIGDAPAPEYAPLADHVVQTLSELLPILKIS